MINTYATKEDYLKYSSKVLESEEIEKYLELASIDINRATLTRIERRGFDNLTTQQKDLIIKATCLQAEYIKEEGEKRGHEVTLLQSNCEGTMIDFLQRAYFEKFDGVVINPGAYTHYSIALHDAIKGNTGIPTVEVHISNVHAREEFRKESKTAPACIGQMCGFGEKGYVLAMEALEDYITRNK